MVVGRASQLKEFVRPHSLKVADRSTLDSTEAHWSCKSEGAGTEIWRASICLDCLQLFEADLSIIFLPIHPRTAKEADSAIGRESRAGVALFIHTSSHAWNIKMLQIWCSTSRFAER